MQNTACTAELHGRRRDGEASLNEKCYAPKIEAWTGTCQFERSHRNCIPQSRPPLIMSSIRVSEAHRMYCTSCGPAPSHRLSLALNAHCVIALHLRKASLSTPSASLALPCLAEAARARTYSEYRQILCYNTRSGLCVYREDLFSDDLFLLFFLLVLSLPLSLSLSLSLSLTECATNSRTTEKHPRSRTMDHKSKRQGSTRMKSI